MPLEATSIHQVQKYPMAHPASSSFYDQKKTSLQNFLIIESSIYMMSMISYLSTKSTVAFSMNHELLTIINLKVMFQVPASKFYRRKRCNFPLNVISATPLIQPIYSILFLP
ncbi:hypothetical protein TorRG33x02_115330 [Trema orientale]|uniref:Uncharacterized protein n=1 Tax=Trema orientale TaxID=63057 RepID=A0A2P5F4E4_TREOI|nr:hypothetical protein TorRG33x02_115330 [Trema orientale]